MGCSPGDKQCNDEEKPPHQVTITRGFWIGQTPVTVGAYKRFTAASGLSIPPEPELMGRALNPGWGNEAMPIVGVAWIEADAYCTWEGGRLPTEAEWEYAARGGSTEARYGYIDDVAWYAVNSGFQRLDSPQITFTDVKTYVQALRDNGNGMHEVGLKRPNAFGLYDMLGNVEEWVNDWYDQNYYQNSPSQDPTGPASGQDRILRGGSFLFPEAAARASYRLGTKPTKVNEDFGFRCGGEVFAP
jgi:formylglycine-generating enzyme required for sulfatase activity